MRKPAVVSQSFFWLSCRMEPGLRQYLFDSAVESFDHSASFRVVRFHEAVLDVVLGTNVVQKIIARGPA